MSNQKPRRPPCQITDAQLRGMVEASRLPPKERSTLLFAADGLNRYDLRITMGFDRLAGLLGLKRRAAIDRMRALERTGVVVIERAKGGRYENGRGRVNVWRLDLESLSSPDPPNQHPAAKGKGAADCTVNGAARHTDNGAVQRREGRSLTTPTVQPAAPDPSSSKLIQEKNPMGDAARQPAASGPADATPGEDAAAAAGTTRASQKPTADPADRRRPWTKRFASADQNREQRLALFQEQRIWLDAQIAGPANGQPPGSDTLTGSN
ncbi:MAG: Lrp/AsnC family transcriptional regulator [Phycisphaerales bacterium]|nr:Lrp/AsnC family transcriptional regulator [Planctomycetota bacterium]MCH8507823.1 Lrp/AsnC family transcriptional regulator [Phycisphaerales bacterium]